MASTAQGPTALPNLRAPVDEGCRVLLSDSTSVRIGFMLEQMFLPGVKTFAAEDAPSSQYSAIFEDDEETGYFYALDLTRADIPILDAVQIYNVANVLDRDRSSTLSIIWSEDGLKCALLINSYAHAAFDFAAKQGYCRTNFPNFSESTAHDWKSSAHTWSDDAVKWLRPG